MGGMFALLEYLFFLLLILCLILCFHVCAHAGLTWNSAILIQVSEILSVT